MKPNIILINCDDLGYGDLGCYGSKVNKTPAIDRMAEEGTRFTDFYMASPVCSPSRGAMLTGCYPPHIGFGDFDGRWVLFPGMQGQGGSNGELRGIKGTTWEGGMRVPMIARWPGKVSAGRVLQRADALNGSVSNIGGGRWERDAPGPDHRRQ